MHIIQIMRRNLRKSGISESAVSHIIAAMQQDHPGAEVRGYLHLVESMTCDPGDRHVLAALRLAGAPKFAAELDGYDGQNKFGDL